MNKPLLISDCDDVLLHFAPHFAEWVAETHGLVFNLDQPNFAGALRDADGEPVARERVWPLLDHFFLAEMHRQHLVPGAFAALKRIGETADIVILTNIGDQHRANRIAQLEAFDIRHRVLCNQGGKGPPVAELIADMAPSATVFVDDLAHHHDSVASHAPDVWRLHMIAEPRLAAISPPAPQAHARIDAWDEALPWILGKLA
ncbi:MAG TPA: HAD family hydrolase [Allosphingosinicella sp.]|nr:HAD family hydrolase [Allosphingosinicella sp.]